jgi:hypothetical protein
VSGALRSEPFNQAIKFYQPWPAPVQAACYRDPSVLPDIDRWVTGLREQGRVPPDVHFTIRERRGDLLAVLRDRAGDHEVPRGGFLVFGNGGLHVLDERSFFRLYRDPE